uniref:NADH-ubiquinone oxidoreductase subunit n=1 Tax=Panagrellus redivivus TaxID=6233 RepID=A0A7E4V0A8_PANRE
MVTITRSGRILRYLQHAPRHLFNKYPEQFVAYSTFGLAGVIAVIYKLNKYGFDGVQPYYRNRYEVVRPDDPRALNWRLPEDYPAPYITNRDNLDYSTVAKDYGWTSKI